MGEETITVGEVSRGDDEGTAVELPIVDLLTGRGFITGKSGSGKSNSASVVAEKLLNRGYSLLAVDIDGEYYGLKEEYEILHVGGDEECDLQVTEEHAEKIAELALEQNVPIILDVSSFLDESEARELLTEVTKHLFAKGKKQKQPFLMLVEEIHEYIPEGGGMDECGRMLIKMSKRGRKHGLGIVGISQRPADVKKDFITQCDWLVWHRLTWNNDTKVVGRILGSEYANYIEEMNDGECFLMTDWAEEIRPVQFERKQTFDAGATPGLDDFERPELKSVSGDLVEELEEISEEQHRRENRIEELERELKQKDERIQDLERQLSEAQDLKQMADRFSRAMMEQVTGRPLSAGHVRTPGRQSELEEAAQRGPVRRDPELEAELEAIKTGEKEPESGPVPDASEEFETDDSGESTASGDEQTGDDQTSGDWTGDDRTQDNRTGDGRTGDNRTPDEDGTDVSGSSVTDETGAGASEGPSSGGTDDSTDGAFSDPFGTEWNNEPSEEEPSINDDPTVAAVASGEASEPTSSPNPSNPTPSTDSSAEPLVDNIRNDIDTLDNIEREMLRQYRGCGPMTPQDAHTAAGGSGERTPAYAANRTLRQRGLVEHVGRGKHDYALASLIVEESIDPFNPNEQIPDSERDRLVRAIEASFLDSVDAPEDTAGATVNATATDGGTPSGAAETPEGRTDSE